MADKGMTISGLVTMVIGIVTLVILFVLVPSLGASMTTAMPVPAGSVWNTSVTTNLPTGVGLWTTLAGIIQIAAMIIIIAGAIQTFRGLRQ